MIAFLIRQRRAVQLLYVLVLLVGAVSVGQLGREELPQPGDEYDGVTITAKLEGASPEEVDRLLARPLHAALKDMTGIKEVDSEASEGFLRCRVRFKREENNPAALSREVAQRVNQISDFPARTDGPFVSRFRSHLWEDMTLVLVGGEDLGRHQQWRWIAQRLKALPAVAELVVEGDRERRVEVQLDALRASAAGIRIDSLAKQLRSALHESAAERLEVPMDLQQLRVKTRPGSPGALAALPITIDGELRPLPSLARVEETLEPARVAINVNGQPGWYMKLYREPGSNIETLSKQLQQVVAEVNAQLVDSGEEYQLLLLKDRSDMVRRSFAGLQFAIASGMALVLLVLWLFVGWRNAVHAALGIPFAFFASFIAMQWLGLNLNLLTLFQYLRH